MFYNDDGGNMEKKQKQILHIDVNNAFLSWTAIDRLEAGETLVIRNIEAVIGGDESKRSGIVLAKSMKAKMKGVTTGETLYQARLKCPNLQVFKGEYKSYKKHSNDLYQMLSQYTDKIERFSIDECFLDMTEYLGYSTLLDKAFEINKRVKITIPKNAVETYDAPNHNRDEYNNMAFKFMEQAGIKLVKKYERKI